MIILISLPVDLVVGWMNVFKIVIYYLGCYLQLPESMKDSQGDLYLETYQVLDIEIGRLREIQRWQSSAAFKVSSHVHMHMS